MSKEKAKKFIKSKQSEKNPGYRTSDFFKAKTFSPGRVKKAGFNPSSFRTHQHRG